MQAEHIDAKPFLYVFFGMIAGGKSYLGERWAQKIDAPYFNSDVVRKDIAGLVSSSRQWLPFNSGIYSPEMSRKTYDELLHLALNELKGNRSCVIDASYTSLTERELVVEKCSAFAKICFVFCECSEEVARDRMEIRASDEDAASDGRWVIYEKQKACFEEIVEIEGMKMVRLDTDKDIKLLLDELAMCCQ